MSLSLPTTSKSFPIQSGIFFIESEEPIESIEILSIEGQIVQKSREALINLRDLAPGIYVVRVQSGHGIHIKRIEKR